MRFIAILLIIGALISGWFMLQKKREENRAVAWAAQLAPHLKDPSPSVSVEEESKKTAANLYWILFYFDKLVSLGMDPSTVLSDACNQINMPSEKAALVQKSLLANYEIAKKYRLYEDTTNVIKMEQGEVPLMKLTGWEDEPAVVGNIIPPSLSPEARGNLANLMLMPSIVSDVQNGKFTTAILENARAMERAQIITKASLDEIIALSKAPGS